MEKLNIERSSKNKNVSETERWASLIGGSALLAYGIGKRSSSGWALAAVGGSLLYRGATGQCGMYKALGVDTASTASKNTTIPYKTGIRVDRSITVNKSAAELYHFWRNLDNLPKFMQHVESVKVIDSCRSHWVAKGPAGKTVEWDAEIINEIENQLIGWRSLEGADVDNAGSVHFEELPGGRGTTIKVELQYNPPGGSLGALVSRLFGEEPNTQVADDLRRFKQLMETGEVATVEGQSSGRATKAATNGSPVFNSNWATPMPLSK